jgi:hypothetical protein
MTETATHRVWIAGNYDDAIRAVREWCDGRGDCYAVSPCAYVFSGGMEQGICVTRINYGRFPESPKDLRERVIALGEHLASRLYQKSYSIETPTETLYLTRGGPWNG